MDLAKSRNVGDAYTRLTRQNLTLRVTHLLLGVIVGLVYMSQLDLSHYRYWGRSGSVLVLLAIPVGPYAASAIFSWNFATRRTSRAVLFVLLLIVTSMLMCKLFLSHFYHQFTMLEKIEGTCVQSLVYVFCASWAFESFFEND
jgi:hypothetical protein